MVKLVTRGTVVVAADPASNPFRERNDKQSFKKWANPGLFLFVFVIFSIQFQ